MSKLLDGPAADGTLRRRLIASVIKLKHLKLCEAMPAIINRRAKRRMRIRGGSSNRGARSALGISAAPRAKAHLFALRDAPIGASSHSYRRTLLLGIKRGTGGQPSSM